MPRRPPTPSAAPEPTATGMAPAATPVAAAANRSGPAKALERLGLATPQALALHLPLRYEDETRLVPLGELRPGSTAQVEAQVQECRVDLRPRRQLVVTLADDEGSTLVLRFVHFYPSHQKTLAVGRRVRVRGEVRGGFFGREMVHPQFKAVEPGAPLATALTPVYPTSAQLPQAYLRKAVAAGLARADLGELLPPSVLPAGLPPLRAALQWLHHPPAGVSPEALEDRNHPAWQRLKFEELLAQQLSQMQSRRERAGLSAPALVWPGLASSALTPTLAPGETDPLTPGPLHQQLLQALPFGLTAAQQRVSQEIAADLITPRPMHRLLQGDVGSGKTVVAALAAARAMDAGWQCALMAPTEILAEQHFAKLLQWLAPLGVTVAWLTGSRKGKARRDMQAQVASGAAQLVVGTHAVIQDDVAFARLGLAIVDEQHRFGVAQRLELRRKLLATDAHGQPLEPHLLMMSATPIPRTLAMTYYADLEVSTIDELPPGRTPIVTKLFADNRREQVIERIAEEVAKGRQVYWVCPLIEESEAEGAGPESASFGKPLSELNNATETHQTLSEALPGVAVGLIHGRLPPAEKAAVMAEFVAGRTAVLVATTVIEVGVDVPNASLMVIEHAERFGLAQLHQLRGRVGRGEVASVCVLLYSTPLSETGKQRLKAMAETTDGFEIARRDLEIRGPGEFMGARQSGDALLRFADLAEDGALLARAREVAPWLLDHQPDAAQAQVARWLGSRAEFLKA